MGQPVFDEPTNELDRRLFHVLSHGQKSQKEIVVLLSTTRFAEKSIRRRVRDLSESYIWAEETKENGEKYYHRTDIGRQPGYQKPPADYSDIEEILSKIEYKLGIVSQNAFATDTLPNIFNNLLEISNRHGGILTHDEHLDRFFQIFDEWINQTNVGHSSGDTPHNYPAKTHGIFYTIVARQHDSWKDGEEHEQYDKELRQRVDELIELLDVVPSKIGNPIIRILTLVDIKKSREGFKKALESNNYSVGKLIEYAESCYAYSNDTDDLIEYLNRQSITTERQELNEKIKQIKNSVRNW